MYQPDAFRWVVRTNKSSHFCSSVNGFGYITSFLLFKTDGTIYPEKALRVPSKSFAILTYCCTQQDLQISTLVRSRMRTESLTHGGCDFRPWIFGRRYQYCDRMHGLSITDDMVSVILLNIIGSYKYFRETVKLAVYRGHSFIREIGICDNPAILIVLWRRVKPNWVAQLWVITGTCDSEFISARQGIHCPHLSWIRMLAILKTLKFVLLAVSIWTVVATSCRHVTWT